MGRSDALQLSPPPVVTVYELIEENRGQSGIGREPASK
jgi:hypothetical protein